MKTIFRAADSAFPQLCYLNFFIQISYY